MKKGNYKKLLLIAVAGVSIALAGCGNSAKNMTFDQTYNAFRESHAGNAVKMFTNLSKTPALHENGDYTLSGSISGGVAVNLAIGADSTVTNEGLDTDSTLTMKGQATQEGLDDTISLDASILLKMVAGQSYINLSKLSLTSAKGNPQISMIGAFSSALTNKWISLASSGVDTAAALKGMSLSNLYALPAVVMQSIKDHPIFTETSKEMVDDNPVYRIALDATGLYLVAKDVVNNDAIKIFLAGQTFTDEDLWNRAQTFVDNAAFEGTLTAYSKNNITLAVTHLNLDETEGLKGTVAEDTSHLEIVDLINGGTGTLATIDGSEKGDVTTFAISVPEQSFSMQLSVDMKKATADDIAYLMGLVISHPNFALDLKGNVSIGKTSVISIEAPTSFQTIDELAQGFSSIIGQGAAGIEGLSNSVK